MRQLERLTQLPPFENPVQYLQARLLRLMVLAVLGISLVYVPLGILLLGFQRILLPISLTAILWIIAPVCLWLSHQRQYERANILFLGSLWGAVSAVVLFGDAELFYPANSFYLIVIMVTAVLMNWKWLVLVGGVSSLLTLERAIYLWLNTPTFTVEQVMIGLSGILAMIFISTFLGLTVHHTRNITLQAYEQEQALQNHNIELQNALEQQQAAQQELQHFFEHSLDLVIITHIPTLQISKVSPSVKTILGWLPADMTGHRPREFIHPDDLPRLAALLPLFQGGGRIYDFEARYLKVDGSYLQLSWNSWSVGDYTYGIARDVTAQREAIKREQSLQLQQQMLEAQERFISVMYHELKTPLSVMNISADLIRDERLPQDRRDKHLTRISNQVKRMNKLINETLRLRRLIDPSYPLESHDISLHTFLEELAEEAEGLAESRKIRVIIAPNVPQKIITDPEVLHHTLANLLSNAIKYSDATIYLSATYDIEDKVYHFKVQDRGIGIPPEDLPHIFEPFYRATNAESQHGTGLGLAIAYDGVMKVGGTISCESQPSKGTTFHVSLPVRASVEVANPPQ